MLFINYRTQRWRALPCPFAISAGVGLPAILPAGPGKHPGGGRQGHLRRRLPGAAPCGRPAGSPAGHPLMYRTGLPPHQGDKIRAGGAVLPFGHCPHCYANRLGKVFLRQAVGFALGAVFCASISFMVYALPCVLPAYHGAVWHTIPYFSIQEKFYFTFRNVLSACIPMV